MASFLVVQESDILKCTVNELFFIQVCGNEQIMRSSALKQLLIVGKISYLCHKTQYCEWCSSQRLFLWIGCFRRSSPRTRSLQTSLTSSQYWWTCMKAHSTRWDTTIAWQLRKAFMYALCCRWRFCQCTCRWCILPLYGLGSPKRSWNEIAPPSPGETLWAWIHTPRAGGVWSCQETTQKARKNWNIPQEREAMK